LAQVHLRPHPPGGMGGVQGPVRLILRRAYTATEIANCGIKEIRPAKAAASKKVTEDREKRETSGMYLGHLAYRN
jgi:hypothetical protein